LQITQAFGAVFGEFSEKAEKISLTGWHYMPLRLQKLAVLPGKPPVQTMRSKNNT
jgi:hypothetical protein